MCGISGIYGIESRDKFPEACAALDRMTKAIAHRGPDATGVWTKEEEVMLGHRRLSIIDTRVDTVGDGRGRTTHISMPHALPMDVAARIEGRVVKKLNR